MLKKKGIGMLRKAIPLIVFILFSSFIIGALLFYAPSWGLMDDFQNLQRAKFVWSGGHFIGNLTQIILGDLSWGMLRPIYYTWAIVAYHFFENSPLLLYLGIAIFNLMALPLWGLILNRIWMNDKKNEYSDIFLYPLSFFIFLPFWNNFMYISPQQKFIIFFTALSIFFFYKGYEKEKKRYFVMSVVAILLGTLSHPEGIFLNCAMLASSLVLYFLTKKNIFIFNFLLNLILFISYSCLTLFVLMKGFYTSKYGHSLNFMSAPAIIKILIFFAVFYFFSLLIVILRKRNKFSPIFLVFPVSFICFIVVLAPWGYPTYHLSVLAPLIMGMFFPVYSFLNSRSLSFKVLSNSILLSVVLLVLLFICFPRISKMSDIEKTEQFIVDFGKKQNGSAYFMSQPCAEACDALTYFSNAKVIYLNDSMLSSDKLISSTHNYIIFRDECPRVRLKGVRESMEIYSNNTWKILSINREDGIDEEFKVDFVQNFLEKIKTFLKK